MAKKSAKKKRTRKTAAAAKEKPVERKMVADRLEPIHIPEKLRNLWPEEDKWCVHDWPLYGCRWDPYMMTGTPEEIRRRLDAINACFPDYEQLQIDVDIERDYDYSELILRLKVVVGKRTRNTKSANKWF